MRTDRVARVRAGFGRAALASHSILPLTRRVLGSRSDPIGHDTQRFEGLAEIGASF
jgi:hypothetical protein